MQLSMVFWVLMIFLLLMGVWGSFPLSGSNARPAANSVLLFILLLILGFAAFGAPIK